MKPLAFCLIATATAAAVSSFVGLSNPGVTRDVVNPGERMVLVPGLEKIGPSRISSVEFCAKTTGSGNWQQLVTDLQFLRMDACLQENT